MNAILVWMADHELSLRTLSARVAACSGACVHSGIWAAMSVSSGTEVAWISNNIGQLVKSARSVWALLRKAQEPLGSGLGVPGFDHPLYPNGDLRARCLLTLMKARGRWTEGHPSGWCCLISWPSVTPCTPGTSGRGWLCATAWSFMTVQRLPCLRWAM